MSGFPAWSALFCAEERTADQTDSASVMSLQTWHRNCACTVVTDQSKDVRVSPRVAGKDSVTSVQPTVRRVPMSLTSNVSIQYHRVGDAGRDRIEAVVQRVFARAYDAVLRDFCPELLSIARRSRVHGVVGLRRAAAGKLFSEQYLDLPVEQLMTSHAGLPVSRTRIIEFGNLAVIKHGDTRWLYTALAAYLDAAGFEWVVCTAVEPLFHLFRRMGLQPVRLAPASLARLAAHRSEWGRYYDNGAHVCFGSIARGVDYLSASILTRRPALRQLCRDAARAGAAYGCTDATLNTTVCAP